ncbi:MAG TPA: DUF2157 domain-containing protein [Polyangiales bacterium]|nr:DUF2157 domain-containing protein [Polyangiales bacterium]
MNLDHKLRRWREAGLIDDATSARIAAFEHAERRPLGMYALIGLGASTVGLGLVSLVAANWEVIPAALKLTVDLVLGVGLALLIQLAFSRQWRLAREALITIFYGYTLASLALVGQIYQLNSPPYQALLTWSLATLPLCLLAESLFLSMLYTAGVVTAHVFALAELVEVLEVARNDGFARNLMASVVFVSPLVYVLLSFVPWLVARRPQYVFSLRLFGASGVLFGGFALAFFWYESLDADETLTWALGVTLLIALGFSWALSRLMAAEPGRMGIGLASVVPAAWLLLAAGTGVPHGSADYLGGLSQVAWLGLCALVSYRALWLRLFHALTAALALRILVIYFEVFGSLLDTGVGLLTGGILTLLIAWFWQKKIRQLGQHVRAEEGGPHAA